MGVPPRLVTLLGVLAVLGSACSASGNERTVVASFYPLAFAAQRIAGPGWKVVDLTPPGTEAHDVELSIQDRAAIEGADVVLYLGVAGFQPQIDRAVRDAPGRLVNVWGGQIPQRLDGEVDPHVWLDPVRFSMMVEEVGEALRRPAAADTLAGRLDELDTQYRTDLEDCRFDTMVVSHEAFGYLAARYGLEQVGLAGIEPEGEPTAEALAEAGALLVAEQAGAVFYEAGAEAELIAQTLAGDAGVPALPLGTLESRPVDGDYLSVMEDNLESLRQGLGCS